MKVIVVISSLIITLGFCKSLNAMGPGASQKFHYNLLTGQCENKSGKVGYNRLNAQVLFSDVELIDGNDAIVKKNAECVDFSNFDFNDIIPLNYTRLIAWNFKGANLSGASFHFGKILYPSFEGTKIAKFSFGYLDILDASYDMHTDYGTNNCWEANSLLHCSQ